MKFNNKCPKCESLNLLEQKWTGDTRIMMCDDCDYVFKLKLTWEVR